MDRCGLDRIPRGDGASTGSICPVSGTCLVACISASNFDNKPSSSHTIAIFSSFTCGSPRLVLFRSSFCTAYVVGVDVLASDSGPGL